MNDNDVLKKKIGISYFTWNFFMWKKWCYFKIGILIKQNRKKY